MNAEREREQHNEDVAKLSISGQMFTSEKIQERLQQFEMWQELLRQGHSSSGRSGRPWRQWIHEDD